MAVGGSSPRIERCLFRGNYGSSAIDIRENSHAVVQKNIFHENLGGCIEGWDSSFDVVNCTFHDCGDLTSFWVNGTYKIVNSIVALGSNGYDWAPIYAMDDAAVEISYTDIWGNAGGDWVDGDWSGTLIADQLGKSGNISEDPMFEDAQNGDLHLKDGSPCLDTGDPDSPTDSDGTPANMGAL